MILADINWLNISINLLLVVFVIVCLLMALLILMQRPKQEGLGAAFGGGVTDQVFGARTTNVLQKGTVYLGSMFFILALTLAILIGKKSKKPSILDDAKTPAAAVISNDGKPLDEPIAPLVDELPVNDTPGPPAEDAPAPPADDTPAPAGGDTPAPAGDEAPAPTATESPVEVVQPPADEPAAEPTPLSEEENNAVKPE